MRAGRCGVSPVLSGFSNGEIFLPQNGAGEGTAALRARLQPSPPEGRQKLRQAGDAPNRKFPVAPAATPAGFELSKRPANTQLSVITRRRCNGVSTALQSSCKAPNVQRQNLIYSKILFPQKTLKLRRNYAGVFGAVSLQFLGLRKMRPKDRISEDFPIEGIENTNPAHTAKL